MEPSDVTIVFCNEVQEWDEYLSECFLHILGPSLKISHLCIESLLFPLPECRAQNVTLAEVVLVIISPAFLDFLESNSRSSQLTNLLQPSKTIALFCGINEYDITSQHQVALVSFDSWMRVVVREEDERFVHELLEIITCTLQQRTEDNEQSQQLHFELWPNVVHQWSRRVLVILDIPTEDHQKLRIILEKEEEQTEVETTRQNPFTFHFLVPDSFLVTSAEITVSIYCRDCYLSEKTLQCKPPMTQLHELLHNVVSPYELLRQSLSATTSEEVDHSLAQSFKVNLPSERFDLLKPAIESKLKSDDELPTLLHFAARYGLKELTSVLVESPGAEKACCLFNGRGLLPDHMARLEGHNEIADILESFKESLEQKDPMSPGCSREKAPTKKRNTYMSMHNFPAHLNKLDVTSLPTASVVEESDIYLDMSGVRKISDESDIPPHERLLYEGHDKAENEEPKETEENLIQSSLDDITEGWTKTHTTPSSQLTDMRLSVSQQQLISILETYKQGSSIIEVEKRFRDWQSQYNMSVGKDRIPQLREAYRQIQNTKKQQSGSKFDFLNIFTGKHGQKDAPVIKNLPVTEEKQLSVRNNNQSDVIPTLQATKHIRSLTPTSKAPVQYDTVQPSVIAKDKSNTLTVPTSVCQVSNLSSSGRLSGTNINSRGDSGIFSDIGEEKEESKDDTKVNTSYLTSPIRKSEITADTIVLPQKFMMSAESSSQRALMSSRVLTAKTVETAGQQLFNSSSKQLKNTRTLLEPTVVSSNDGRLDFRRRKISSEGRAPTTTFGTTLAGPPVSRPKKCEPRD
ncbi:uncharacterized protein LOC143234398 isoform X2 [Tachypleus tridentatus]|uniref:uncharacterized protein LOC143234398 isoform X2 n=1 Tax=Tachypleus tridentatus TaxID=6853 RepID=UPI003FD4AD29